MMPGSSARSGSSPRTPRPTRGCRSDDHLHLGAWLNPSWDDELAKRRIEQARPRSRPARRQALRRRARPARPHPGGREAARSADPRRAGGQPRPARPSGVPPAPDGVAVAEHELSIVLSSHLVADLERVCDYLVVLAVLTCAGRRRGRRNCSPPIADSSGRAAIRMLSRLIKRSSRRATPTSRARWSSAVDEPDPRPGLDRRAAEHGRPGARLHGPSPRPAQAPAAVHGACCGDPAHLAPVPHPGRGGRGLLGRDRDVPWPSPARISSTSTTPQSCRARPEGDCSLGDQRVPQPRQPPARLLGIVLLVVSRASSGSSGARRSWPANSRPARSGSPGPRASPARAGWRSSSASSAWPASPSPGCSASW